MSWRFGSRTTTMTKTNLFSIALNSLPTRWFVILLPSQPTSSIALFVCERIRMLMAVSKNWYQTRFQVPCLSCQRILRDWLWWKLIPLSLHVNWQTWISSYTAASVPLNVWIRLGRKMTRWQPAVSNNPLTIVIALPAGWATASFPMMRLRNVLLWSNTGLR